MEAEPHAAGGGLLAAKGVPLGGILEEAEFGGNVVVELEVGHGGLAERIEEAVVAIEIGLEAGELLEKEVFLRGHGQCLLGGGRSASPAWSVAGERPVRVLCATKLLKTRAI